MAKEQERIYHELMKLADEAEIDALALLGMCVDIEWKASYSSRSID